MPPRVIEWRDDGRLVATGSGSVFVRSGEGRAAGPRFGRAVAIFDLQRAVIPNGSMIVERASFRPIQKIMRGPLGSDVVNDGARIARL